MAAAPETLEDLDLFYDSPVLKFFLALAFFPAPVAPPF